MNDFLLYVEDLIQQPKKLALIICAFFILGTIVGYVSTVYFNTLNKQSVEYKIKKGELIRYYTVEVVKNK